jgi:hypothetical protein
LVREGAGGYYREDTFRQKGASLSVALLKK